MNVEAPTTADFEQEVSLKDKMKKLKTSEMEGLSFNHQFALVFFFIYVSHRSETTLVVPYELTLEKLMLASLCALRAKTHQYIFCLR